jgi:cell fate regulator YaaT (PSP1 superfamily)
VPLVIPVHMHFSSDDLWFDPVDTGAGEGDYVVVTTERGTEFGLACAEPFDAPASEITGKLKPVLRVASEQDIQRAEELASKGDEAMPVFRQLVKKHGLDIKPAGVEFLFGGEKIVFYFAAEERVDFRELVHDLASQFHSRVDMRQIGVRDEARLQGGYATCGQELCCRRMGGAFEPVSIRMAKEQDLPLNSAKISGVCGRLMCCLRYEFEAYKDFKQRAPKRNTLIDTPLGKAKIIEYNTPRETLTLRLDNGKSFTVALEDMTCSEGCKKRSKGQDSLARPDTVNRNVLEKIGTAEILAQLAELDRQENPEAFAYELDASLVKPRRRTPSGSRAQTEAAERHPGSGSGSSSASRSRAGSPSSPRPRSSRTLASYAENEDAVSPSARSEKGREPRRRSSGKAESPARSRKQSPQASAAPARTHNPAASAGAGSSEQADMRPQRRKGMRPHRQHTSASQAADQKTATPKAVAGPSSARETKQQKATSSSEAASSSAQRRTRRHRSVQDSPRPETAPSQDQRRQHIQASEDPAKQHSEQEAPTARPRRSRKPSAPAATDQQGNRQAEHRADRQTDRQTDQRAERQPERRAERQAGTQTSGKSDRQVQDASAPRGAVRRHHRHPGDHGGQTSSDESE